MNFDGEAAIEQEILQLAAANMCVRSPTVREGHTRKHRDEEIGCERFVG